MLSPTMMMVVLILKPISTRQKAQALIGVCVVNAEADDECAYGRAIKTNEKSFTLCLDGTGKNACRLERHAKANMSIHSQQLDVSLSLRSVSLHRF